MAGISLPLWTQLKTNLVAILEEVATAEALVDPGRNFIVTRDRWRPWIESQQNVAMVNVMVDSIEPGGGGSRRYLRDEATVNLDLYALGTYEEQDGELTPADEIAAARLDLLAEQTRHAILRMVNRDFGFPAGQVDTGNLQLSLLIYSQEREEVAGQYAPARWTFRVGLPYFPAEAETIDMTQLDVNLQQFAVRYTYDSP